MISDKTKYKFTTAVGLCFKHSATAQVKVRRSQVNLLLQKLFMAHDLSKSRKWHCICENQATSSSLSLCSLSPPISLQSYILSE